MKSLSTDQVAYIGLNAGVCSNLIVLGHIVKRLVGSESVLATLGK